MGSETERKIREHAYHLWASSGYPDGLSEEHWLRAERAFAEASAVLGPSPKPAKGRSASAGRKTSSTPKARTRAAAHAAS